MRTYTFMLFTLAADLAARAAGQEHWAPRRGECPNRTVEYPYRPEWIRPASGGLSTDESRWVRGRAVTILDPLEDWLKRLDMGQFQAKFDVLEYMVALRQSNVTAQAPRVALCIAASGWADAVAAAGALRALDDRHPDARDAGTGGLLQVAMYMAGVSGGAWPVVSLAAAGLPLVDDMVASWALEVSRIDGSTTDRAYGASAAETMGRVAAKARAGFNVSVADYLGQALAWEFAPGTAGGLNVTMSDLAKVPALRSWNMPLPIVQMAGLNVEDKERAGLKVPDMYRAVNYELTPFEFGTWEGEKGAFAPTEFLGTSFTDGKPANSSDCVTRFDTLAFTLGATSNAFSTWHAQAGEARWQKARLGRRWGPKGKGGNVTVQKRTAELDKTSVQELVRAFKQELNSTVAQLAYTSMANPFGGTEHTQSTLWGPERLATVDGSQTGNALAMSALTWPARGVDLIVVWGGAGETRLGWQQGRSLYRSFRQAQQADRVAFPMAPRPATFVRRGYAERPVMLGCDKRLTTIPSRGGEAPIVLHLPGAPYGAYGNGSAAQSGLRQGQAQQLLDNSFDVTTQDRGRLGGDWARCVACAVVERSRERLELDRAEVCDDCFRHWCWDGKEDDTADEAGADAVDLTMKLGSRLSFAEWSRINH